MRGLLVEPDVPGKGVKQVLHPSPTLAPSSNWWSGDLMMVDGSEVNSAAEAVERLSAILGDPVDHPKSAPPMLIKFVDKGDARFLALCDSNGDVLPMQIGCSYQSYTGEFPTIDVRFGVDGERIKFALDDDSEGWGGTREGVGG